MRTKIALVAAALLPSLAVANGYDVPNITPRDLALVESAVAAQNDAGATYALPAALSRVRGLSLNLAGSMLDNSTTWSAPGGSVMAGSPDASTKFKPATPVALFAAYGLDVGGRGLGFGVGMNVVAGGNMNWAEDWAGRGRIITVDRRVYGFYLTGGVEVVEGLRAGGGLVYYYTTEYLKQGVQPDPSAYGELSTKGGAPSFDVSLEYTPAFGNRPLTLAVDYKHKGTQNLTGDGNFVVPSALLLPGTNPPPVSQGVSHQLTYPNVFNVGIAYRPPVDGLQITGVYTLTRYKVYDSDTFAGDKGTVITVPRNYGNGQTFRLGAEYETTRRLTLRAGVLRDVSGFKTDTFSPTIPDGNSWCGAVGATWKFTPDLSASGAFFYSLFDTVNTTGTTVMPGKYDTNVYIVSLGLNWRTDLGMGK
jgi:long-chain fatty acid transport protein